MSNAAVQTSVAVVYDPDGSRTRDMPLDREPVMRLAAAILERPAAGDTPPPEDCEQIARLLAGHAHLVADDVQALCARLPHQSPLRRLTEAALGEARQRLERDPRATLASAQTRARVVRLLYERLDRLQSLPPA